jgi:hypothetical protein
MADKKPWEMFAAPEEQGPWSKFASTPKKPEIPERSWSEVPTDIGASLVSGLGGLAQFPGQVYGLATGAIKDKDFAKTGLYGIGQEMQDYAKSIKSENLKAKEAAVEEKVQEAAKQGEIPAFQTSFVETVKDPTLIGSFLLEQAPQAIPSLIAALIPGAGPVLAAEIKTLQTAAKLATNPIVKKATEEALTNAIKKGTQEAVERGATAAVRTAAVQQGADIGAGTYDAMYKYLTETKGLSPEQAADETINYARAAGIGGGALSLLAQRLPGAKAFERALAGERTGVGRFTGAALGAIKETPGENVEEVGGRLLQNIAMKQVNPEQSLTEGLGQTAAQATIGAAGMGGIGGAFSGRAKAEAPPAPQVEKPVEPEQKPLAIGMSQPFTPVSLPDGSVALTKSDLDAYEQEQFDKKYAAQPNLNQVVPAETPPQLGYSPLPGVPKITQDGTVLLTPEQEFEAQYAPQKTRMTAEVWNAMSPEEKDAASVKATLEEQQRIRDAEVEAQGKVK